MSKVREEQKACRRYVQSSTRRCVVTCECVFWLECSPRQNTKIPESSARVVGLDSHLSLDSFELRAVLYIVWGRRVYRILIFADIQSLSQRLRASQY